MNYIIEIMKPSDWDQVSQIYLDGINTEIATFTHILPTWEEWDKNHAEDCRLVAKNNDKILGWAALNKTSPRECYSGVVELSIYIHRDYSGMGIGYALIKNIIKEAKKSGYWTIESKIIRENVASRALHKKCGFREVGYREKMGKMISGKWHDVIILEYRIDTLDK